MSGQSSRYILMPQRQHWFAGQRSRSHFLLTTMSLGRTRSDPHRAHRPLQSMEQRTAMIPFPDVPAGPGSTRSTLTGVVPRCQELGKVPAQVACCVTDMTSVADGTARFICGDIRLSVRRRADVSPHGRVGHSGDLAVILAAEMSNRRIRFLASKLGTLVTKICGFHPTPSILAEPLGRDWRTYGFSGCRFIRAVPGR